MNQQDYRNTDPWTSRQVPDKQSKQKLHSIVLQMIGQHPNITAGQLGALTNKDGLWKRLPELEKKGLIERSGVALWEGTGKWQTTWKIREQQQELELGNIGDSKNGQDVYWH